MFDNLFGRFYEQFIVQKGYEVMLEGLQSTVIIALGALLIGVLMGTLVAIVKVWQRHSVVGWLLNAVADLYIAIIRGTPVTVQLLLVYFGLLSPLGVSALIVAILVFGLNSGAYVAEIIRSGIQAVDKGQMEAGRSLGLSYGVTMKKIILPQAVKNILPALGNEFIALIKETSVAGFITVFDLTRAARSIVSKTYDPLVPYLVLALMYLVLVLIATVLVHQLERVLHKSD